MKKTPFYAGLAGIVLFEILKVYFIMPMPGSQRMASLDAAYFIHSYRWVFRIACLLAIAAGASGALAVRRKWVPAAATLVALGIVGFFNLVMTADHMFKQPANLVLKNRAENTVDESSIVVGVEHNGEAKAYPIRFLVYHHQVQDTVGGKSVLVTYCSVCRTGRVFEPVVNGRPEKFRLVGMDHFNAMFEDATTGSWWRQVTGEAVTGALKGATLPEVAYRQLTLGQWFDLHPRGLVMQPDTASVDHYDALGKYERGKSEGDLTRTDPGSWQEKSWVVGVQLGTVSKAYDWNRLKKERVINDEVAGTRLVLVLAGDLKSFAVFERSGGNFSLQGNLIAADGHSYDFLGRDAADPALQLKRVPAYQEFWHSWRTFHPQTLQDK